MIPWDKADDPIGNFTVRRQIIFWVKVDDPLGVLKCWWASYLEGYDPNLDVTLTWILSLRISKLSRSSAFISYCWLGSSVLRHKIEKKTVCFHPKIFDPDRLLWPKIVFVQTKRRSKTFKPKDHLLSPTRSSTFAQKIVCFHPSGPSAFESRSSAFCGRLYPTFRHQSELFNVILSNFMSDF